MIKWLALFLRSSWSRWKKLWEVFIKYIYGKIR